MNINNTLLQLQNDTNRMNFQRARENLGNDRLDKNAFLQLLMARLQHQDPLNPVKDEDFLTQQAQLAQVEKLDDVAKLLQNNSTISEASAMVGKKVDVKNEFNQIITGTVESASFSNGTAALRINGQDFTLDQISKIYAG